MRLIPGVREKNENQNQLLLEPVASVRATPTGKRGK